MLQATLFVLIGAFVGMSFTPLQGILFFLLNLAMAVRFFLRAVKLRVEIAQLAPAARTVHNDRSMLALLVLSVFITALFSMNSVQRIAYDRFIDSVGRCWSTDDTNSYAVDCDNPTATYRTTDIVDDKSLCKVEYLARENGQFICVEPIGQNG
jgi:hypothetical protein